MEKVKGIILWILVIGFIGLFFLLFLNLPRAPGKEEQDSNKCDYFNGEVLEMTEEYLWIRPDADWSWGEAARVKIPRIQNWEGDVPEQRATTLAYGDISTLKAGDRVRVAFNSGAMERSGEEVSLQVVFMIFRWTEDGE